jgi:hypothetical protein
MITFILVLIAIILLPLALWGLFRVLFSWQFWVLVGAAWLFISYASREGERMEREKRAAEAVATPTPSPTPLNPATCTDEENEDAFYVLQYAAGLTPEQKQRIFDGWPTGQLAQRILNSPSDQLIMVRRHNQYVATHGGEDYIPHNPFTARPFDNN